MNAHPVPVRCEHRFKMVSAMDFCHSQIEDVGVRCDDFLPKNLGRRLGLCDSSGFVTTSALGRSHHSLSCNCGARVIRFCPCVLGRPRARHVLQDSLVQPEHDEGCGSVEAGIARTLPPAPPRWRIARRSSGASRQRKHAGLAFQVMEQRRIVPLSPTASSICRTLRCA